MGFGIFFWVGSIPVKQFLNCSYALCFSSFAPSGREKSWNEKRGAHSVSHRCRVKERVEEQKRQVKEVRELSLLWRGVIYCLVFVSVTFSFSCLSQLCTWGEFDVCMFLWVVWMCLLYVCMCVHVSLVSDPSHHLKNTSSCLSHQLPPDLHSRLYLFFL